MRGRAVFTFSPSCDFYHFPAPFLTSFLLILDLHGLDQIPKDILSTNLNDLERLFEIFKCPETLHWSTFLDFGPPFFHGSKK